MTGKQLIESLDESDVIAILEITRLGLNNGAVAAKLDDVTPTTVDRLSKLIEDWRPLGVHGKPIGTSNPPRLGGRALLQISEPCVKCGDLTRWVTQSPAGTIFWCGCMS